MFAKGCGGRISMPWTLHGVVPTIAFVKSNLVIFDQTMSQSPSADSATRVSRNKSEAVALDFVFGESPWTHCGKAHPG